MPICKWCDKKGLFLQLTNNGLCKECEPVLAKIILEKAKIFQESIIELDNYISARRGLNIIDKIKNALSSLKQFEVKGIPTITPLPSELLINKIYGSLNESISEIERRLTEENKKNSSDILTLDCELFVNEVIKLEGDFTFDEHLKCFIQQCKGNPELAKWCQYNRIGIEFSEDYNSGYYREYYSSNNLRREVSFIKESDSRNLLADGLERVYYEDLDSNGEETYLLIEENSYKKSDKCGISKKYSIDGGLMSEEFWDTRIHIDGSIFYGIERKEYYPSTSNLKLEEYKDWGKEYYESGSIKAKWTNINYLKCGDYIGYHENGQVKMTVNYNDSNNRDGLMYKYFDNGKLKELWSYVNGNRKFVKKYFGNGILKTEWLYDDYGNEISKKYFDINGNLIVK